MPDWAPDLAIETGYWLSITLLIVAAIAGWASNFITLPGNWIVVALAIGAALFEADGEPVLSWTAVAILLALGLAGEGLEFLASAAGAKKQGASRRGVVLAIAGAMTGSLVGAGAGVPIPVVGPLVGAVLGGGIGAFGGAYLGEWWKRDRSHRDRMSIAAAAFGGRLVGTLGKLAVGSVMLVVFIVGLFL